VHFLIDADLPRSVKPLLERYGHLATDVRDIGLTSAKDPQIALYAQGHKTCLMTGDFGFADIPGSAASRSENAECGRIDDFQLFSARVHCTQIATPEHRR
jgi:predicted nuclease of predicted toxin-antitoxin system